MDLRQLVDLELIRQLKYRYMRGVDTRDIALIGSCLTEGATASYSGGAYIMEGRDAICAFIERVIDPTSGTSHIAVHPEIEFEGDNRARGIWRLEDTIQFTRPNPAVKHVDIQGGEELQGAGYYYDEYERDGSTWRISHTSYGRLYERVARLGGCVDVPSMIDIREMRNQAAVRHKAAQKSVKARVSHFGICVSDLDRAICFYRDGLGFSEGGGIEVADTLGNVMGMDEFSLRTRMMSLGGISIELLHFPRSQDPVRADRLRAMNHTGFTHMALAVEDVDAAARLVVAHGGIVFPETRAVLETDEGPVTMLYCADPDYTRVELVSYP